MGCFSVSSSKNVNFIGVRVERVLLQCGINYTASISSSRLIINNIIVCCRCCMMYPKLRSGGKFRSNTLEGLNCANKSTN